MNTFALGFRVKSGWAVAVALSGTRAAPSPVMRSVVALSDPKTPKTRQPYHEGFGEAQEDLHEVRRLVTIIERCAEQSLTALLSAGALAGRRCRGASLVVGSVIDPAKVGNPHIRAHASEGKLFREVVARALAERGIKARIVVEKQLGETAAAALKRSPAAIGKTIGEIGRQLGKPWRADEKAAATAAWLALV